MDAVGARRGDRLEFAKALAAALLVLLAGLALTGWSALEAAADQEADLRATFDFRVRDAQVRLEERLQAYEQVLRGAAALFDASDLVDRREFRAYVESLRLAESYPGIQGVGFSRVIPAAALAAHQAELRREGFAGYQVRPPGPREPYTSIVYLEPFTGRNLRAFGYDMFSEPVRQAAMARARDTGRPALSGRVTLVQETDRDVQAGTLLYLPVYRPPTVEATLEERRARLVGWVYSPYRMHDLMLGILGERAADLDFEVYDGPAPTSAALLFDSDDDVGAGAGAAAHPAHFHGSRPLEFAGRPWTLVVHSLPAFEAPLRSGKPRLIAWNGLGVSLLLAALVALLATGRARAVRAARRMNAELLAAQAELERRNADLVHGHAQLVEEARLFSLARAVNDAELVLRLDGTIVSVNDRAEVMYGRPREALLRLTIRDLRAPGSLAEVQAQMAGVLAAGHGVFEAEHLRADGTPFAVEVSSRRLVADGQTYLHSLVRDVSERRLLQEQLRRAVREQALVLENAQVGIFLVVERRMVWASRHAEALFGYPPEALAGLPTARLYPSEEAWRTLGEEAYPALAAGGIYRTLREFRRKDGTCFWASLSGKAVDPASPQAGSIWTFEDVTERRALEARLLAASRLASVGTLAAGVAHEINNPLAFVHANLGLCLEQLDGADGPAVDLGALRELLAEALAGTGRIAAIVKAMRALGRPEPDEAAAPVDVAAELSAALKLAGRKVEQRARVELLLDPGLPLVVARGAELGRAFLNLLVNAAEALPEGEAGRHRISVSARQAGGQVTVTVSDTGPGIPPEVRARIFDPFFTTKPVGQGTGLGLSITRSIVEGAGGRIEVASAPGQGTTFTIHLPAAPDPARPQAPQPAPPTRPAAEQVGRRLRVLVVDDEPLVGRAVSRVLSQAHEVCLLSSGAEALRRVEAGERWDAMLFDFMMPGLDGIEIYAALEARHPELLPRLAFVTGGAYGERATSFLGSHEVLVLPKPVERGPLLAAVARLAGAGPAAGEPAPG